MSSNKHKTNNNKLIDKNTFLEFCHNLYDNGYLSLYKGLLQVSTFINNYDLYYKKNKQITNYNLQNEKYFIYHYNCIYKTTI